MRPRDDQGGEWVPPDFPDFPDPPVEPADPFVVECAITSPTAGATLTGPWNGVTVDVRGQVTIASGTGAVTGVQVQIGGGEFLNAVALEPGWATWSCAKVFTSASSLAIVARVLGAGGAVLAERSITVATKLASQPSENPEPSPKTTPPVVKVAQPLTGDSFVLDATGRAKIDIAVSVEDGGEGGKLDRVEVLLDGMPVEGLKLTPNQGKTRIDATGTAVVAGLGAHSVLARAVAADGREATARADVTVVSSPSTPPVVERLLLVEKCRLVTCSGNFGAGQLVKIVTLAPGERTKVVVKSYKRSSDTAKAASSILDSVTEESQKDFEETLAREQSDKRTSQEALSWNASLEGGANWGVVSASMKAGVTATSNASREELAKNVANAVKKHADKASSKREIEIKTDRETKREEGEEFSNESEIQNINMSRTLNLLYYYAIQELFTFLTLENVRVAYVRGDRAVVDGVETINYRYTEVALSQLDGLLREVIVPERRDDVRREIITALSNVYDYEDERHTMVEERVIVDADGNPIPNGSYLRVPRGKVSTYKDPATGSEMTVPGVILAVTKNVMRTESVLSDCVLGEGKALDAYSTGLQEAAVEAKEIENGRQRASLDMEALAVKLVEWNDGERAKVLREVRPEPDTESLALVTAAPSAPETNGSQG